MNIPDGWQKVETGAVRLGDQVWAAETQRFIEVDEVQMRHLAFLDALEVEELLCVIRRKRHDG